MLCRENLEKLFLESGLDFKFGNFEKDEWHQVFHKLPYSLLEYSNSNIIYQNAYHHELYDLWLDASIIIYWNNTPVALWPLHLSKQNSEIKISSSGGLLLAPVFISDINEKSEKKIVKACYEALVKICNKFEIPKVVTAQSYMEKLGYTEWQSQLLRSDAAFSVRHELYIDLSRPIDQIKSNFRKSYKGLISAGQKLWQIECLDGENHAVWQEFQNLHLEVAGRKTRSQQSWDIQEQSIIEQSAFLVYLRDKDNRMVGGGLFSVTPTEGVYSVAAYDRNLFDKPLGHVVQYRAIEELQKLNLRWYRLGNLSTIHDDPAPTDKEINISKFKQGFATHCFPKICATLKFQN